MNETSGQPLVNPHHKDTLTVKMAEEQAITPGPAGVGKLLTPCLSGEAHSVGDMSCLSQTQLNMVFHTTHPAAKAKHLHTSKTATILYSIKGIILFWLKCNCHCERIEAIPVDARRDCFVAPLLTMTSSTESERNRIESTWAYYD